MTNDSRRISRFSRAGTSVAKHGSREKTCVHMRKHKGKVKRVVHTVASPAHEDIVADNSVGSGDTDADSIGCFLLLCVEHMEIKEI